MEGLAISEMISSGLTDLISEASGILTTTGPALIGVAGTFIAFNVGFKLFKRFGNKIG